MPKPLKEKVSITLDVDIVEAIRNLADEDDRAFSSYINRVLRKYIAYKDQIDRGWENPKKEPAPARDITLPS